LGFSGGQFVAPVFAAQPALCTLGELGMLVLRLLVGYVGSRSGDEQVRCAARNSTLARSWRNLPLVLGAHVGPFVGLAGSLETFMSCRHRKISASRRSPGHVGRVAGASVGKVAQVRGRVAAQAHVDLHPPAHASPADGDHAREAARE